jgi:hypothetical protein
VARAIERNLAALGTRSHGEAAELLFTGHGWPLLDRAMNYVRLPCELMLFPKMLSGEASRCAPAVAVAWLWQHGQV